MHEQLHTVTYILDKADTQIWLTEINGFLVPYKYSAQIRLFVHEPQQIIRPRFIQSSDANYHIMPDHEYWALCPRKPLAKPLRLDSARRAVLVAPSLVHIGPARTSFVATFAGGQ